jgi:hypothetical protein
MSRHHPSQTLTSAGVGSIEQFASYNPPQGQTGPHIAADVSTVASRVYRGPASMRIGVPVADELVLPCIGGGIVAPNARPETPPRHHRRGNRGTSSKEVSR